MRVSSWDKQILLSVLGTLKSEFVAARQAPRYWRNLAGTLGIFGALRLAHRRYIKYWNYLPQATISLPYTSFVGGRATDLSQWNVHQSRLTSREIEAQYLAERDKQVSLCLSNIGIIPLSFSSPREFQKVQALAHKDQVVSTQYPSGQSTDLSEAEYNLDYIRSFFALSHRKAGWDAFRHLEILRNGCFPLMPDVMSIPPCTMVHYPKTLLAHVLDVFRAGELPSDTMYAALESLFDKYLTSRSRIHFLTEHMNYEGGGILFLDAREFQSIDYLSIMTLVGLMQEHSKDVTTHSIPTLMYQDAKGESPGFYGRGFNYTRALAGDQNPRQILPSPLSREATLDYASQVELVLLSGGGINLDLLRALSKQGRKVGILWGADYALTRRQINQLRNVGGVTIFAREIY